MTYVYTRHLQAFCQAVNSKVMILHCEDLSISCFKEMADEYLFFSNLKYKCQFLGDKHFYFRP